MMGIVIDNILDTFYTELKKSNNWSTERLEMAAQVSSF